METNNTKGNEGGGEIPMQALTEDQIEEIREVMAKYKTNHVGMINPLYACEAMYDLGLYRTEAEVSEMFEEVGWELREEISEEQFLSVMTKAYQQLYNQESLEAAFNVFDEDKTKLITAGQLRSTAHSLGASFTDTEFEEMFREVDNDNDGKIGWADFIHAVIKP